MDEIYHSPPLADQTDIARPFRRQSAAVTTPVLRPENLRALDLLDAWMSEPDDLGEAWWDDFERELQQHRFSLLDP